MLTQAKALWQGEHVPIARKIRRDQRQMQIILATMRVLARKGFASTMISDVASEAGVSHGLVIFHFETKEKLLTATLLHMAEEYRNNWTTALAKSGPHPAEQLDALIRADFDKAICTPEHLACWCAFWGEAQSRPIYQQECAPNDKKYIRNMEKICAALIKQGRHDHDAVRTARILRLVSDGLWLDILSMKNAYNRKEALRTMFTCAAVFFPKHFTPEGLV
jgi:AcrR family transcriptional regulator